MTRASQIAIPRRAPASTVRRRLRWLPLAALLLVAAGCQARLDPEPAAEPGGAVDGPGVTRLDPAEAARLAEEARAGMEVELAPGLEIDVWATEPLLIDPIALDVDHQGRVYITGSTRTRQPLDIRGHPGWTTEALRMRTVEDHRAFFRRELAPERSAENEWLPDFNEDGSRDWRDLTVLQERVYRLEDLSGDGRADLSQVVMEGFDTEVTDLAGGLLVHQGDIYVGAAPDVWRLRDRNGDGAADSVESISHGYAVHPGFGGHGLSGLVVGPDGRIYWGIGDFGFHVTDREGRTWSYPNQGAILRSEPDGSGFEVFAVGLRNPHEFAFDEFGNLITVDNDGDHPGETERLVYVVDGSDSGWRVNWQFGKYTDPANNDYKVWMDERLYLPRWEGQAAYILPPLASYHTGPSGLAYNPGTALDERWRGHFVVSEFTGSPATAKIHAFSLSPSGAGFQLARDTVMMRGVLTTGLRFGPDGALYLADWVEGWDATGTGRVWKLDSPAAAASPLRAETRALLAEPFGDQSRSELARLLRHPDMRVRQKAQFELAERGDARTLLAAARQREHRLARVHALWGIGQLARREAGRAESLVPFLRDADPEIRALAARLLGDVRHAAAADALLPLLRDAEPRPRFFAAEALGRIGHRPAVQPIVAMLEADDGRDTYLRHAGTLALARIGDAESLTALAGHPSRAVRVAGVVALRRMRHPGVARFLADADEYVVTEAARAINDDGSIEAALPELARVLDRPGLRSEPLVRRAISANLRLGTPEAARRLAAYAARDAAPEGLRVDAVAALGVLPEPSPLDRVDGMYHGPEQRDPAIAVAALEPLLASHLERGGEALRVALAEAAGRLGAAGAAPALLARVRSDPSPRVRTAALRALQAMEGGSGEEAVRAAMEDPEAEVRMAALSLVSSLGLPPATTVELLASVVGRGTVQEQQSALEAISRLRGAEVSRTLDGLTDGLEAGRLPPEIQLDVAEAVQASGDPALIARLERLRATREAEGPVAAFRDALHGGDAQRGRRVVMQNPAGQCTRCHAFDDGGPNVGPDLRGIGAVLSREQLLEALVAPSARIAPGYGQPPSAMPPMQHLLSRREIRDVVEYLSTLR